VKREGGTDPGAVMFVDDDIYIKLTMVMRINECRLWGFVLLELQKS
jgi:hypothetical protein